MSGFDPNAQANKTASLNQLRNHLNASAQPHSRPPSHPLSHPGHNDANSQFKHSPYWQATSRQPQPAQSRDATQTSRFWAPQTPPSIGNVLVPGSDASPQDWHRPGGSPRQGQQSSPYRPTHPLPQYPPPQHQHSHQPQHQPYAPWNAQRTQQTQYRDVLSAPSGFLPPNGAGADANRAWGRKIGEVDGTSTDDGPARKRANLGTHTQKPLSHDELDLFRIRTPDAPRTLAPDSPDVKLVGQRRRPVPIPGSGSPLSSDESTPDMRLVIAAAAGDGPAKRIVRGERPVSPRSLDKVSSSTSSTASADDATRFAKFRLIVIDKPADHVKAAWDEAGGDVKLATDLIHNSAWRPKRPAPPSSPSSSSLKDSPGETTGRVKEIDEAHKASRAAARQKALKSAIYQNRTNLDTAKPGTGAGTKPSAPVHAPSPVKPSAPKRAETPPSPMTPLPAKRKRLRRAVADSESEAEFGGSDASSSRHVSRPLDDDDPNERRALEYFNTAATEALQELTGCGQDQAQKIISLRPFVSVADLQDKLGQGKKKAGPAGISPRMFEDCAKIFEGYNEVDQVLRNCERIGSTLRTAIAAWTTSREPSGKGKGKQQSDSSVVAEYQDSGDGALSMVTLAPAASADYLAAQPTTLSGDLQLKDYQLAGLNWLRLLYRKGLSCILADDMGLGKTVQVISFIAHLQEAGIRGPHLVVVPSSTLENWCREFARFAPSIAVQTYYAGKEERPSLRKMLETSRAAEGVEDGWEVLITTYNLAQGDERDRKFFRNTEWDCCIFDEGHVLKNFQSQRYQALLKYESRWRLLLTGTPLQNNLQELVSLMNFILPDQFHGALNSLRAIFRVKGDSKVSLLAEERVSRAKKMMTPFVLRRRKDQVLKDLPKKVERIEWCELTPLQRSIYRDTLQRSRKTVFDVAGAEKSEDSVPVDRNGVKKKKKAPARPKDKLYVENSANVLMELRKAALHPMLFRKRFTDGDLTGIARLLIKEPDFKKRGAVFDLVKEDMEVMTDAELQLFVGTYKSTAKYSKDDSCYAEAGKVTVLLKLLEQYRKEARRVLVFSQFTQVLDILQALFRQLGIKYLVLTGSTAVDVRQALVDDFNEDESIEVFLLSTKAGGMGINLTAANVVIFFDQDFNPHNDRQAQDRAYRIGQKRDVDVVKLIAKNSIEEDILRLGETKLALDEAVAGEADDEGGDKADGVLQKKMQDGLLSVLRKQLEAGDESSSAEGRDAKVSGEAMKGARRADSPLTDVE